MNKHNVNKGAAADYSNLHCYLALSFFDKKDIHYSNLKSFKELLVGFVYFNQVMLLVIIPQIKQAISRAIATFATFDFFSF